MESAGRPVQERKTRISASKPCRMGAGPSRIATEGASGGLLLAQVLCQSHAHGRVELPVKRLHIIDGQFILAHQPDGKILLKLVSFLQSIISPVQGIFVGSEGTMIVRLRHIGEAVGMQRAGLDIEAEQAVEGVVSPIPSMTDCVDTLRPHPPAAVLKCHAPATFIELPPVLSTPSPCQSPRNTRGFSISAGAGYSSRIVGIGCTIPLPSMTPRYHAMI